MIKIQWLASIWRQNDQKCWVTSQNIQNKGKLQKWSKSNDLHRFDVKTIETKLNYKSDQNPMTWIKFDVKTFKTKQIYKTDQITMKCWLRRKTFKTKLNYKSDQNPMTCIDLTSKRSKCWVTSQNIQNKAKLQKWSKSNDLHRFDARTFKTKQNYKTDQITMNCIDSSKRSKNKAKLQKWSKSNDLHRFDVKTIKNVELRRKTCKTTKVIKIQWLASIWRQNDKNDSKQS